MKCCWSYGNLIKPDFFQTVTVSILLYRCALWSLKTHRKHSWKQQKDALCYFKKNPGSRTRQNKTHLSATNKTFSVLLQKKGLPHKRRFYIDSDTWTRQCWETSNLKYSDTRCRLEDLPGMIDDGEWIGEGLKLNMIYIYRERESERERERKRIKMFSIRTEQLR